MRWIELITGCALALSGAAWLLPDPWRLPSWGALAVVYLGVCVWGASSMRSRVFAVARCRGDSRRPQVALTYDDGPDPRSTPALLELLKERGVRATFFVVGEKVRRHPDLVRRIHDEGHLVGNHSDGHSWTLNFLGEKPMREEVLRCQEAVESATGQAPRHYRPPHGLVNHAVGDVCRRLGLLLVGWSVRSLDTVRPPASVLRRVCRSLAPGAIVLLHDGGRPVESVLAVTRGVLDELERRGLRAVRLDQLLSS